MTMAHSSTASFIPTALQPEAPEAKAAFDKRWQRIIDLVELRTPDRMPVALYATFWMAKYGGISCKQLMYDYETTRALGEQAVLEFEPDVAAAAMVAGVIYGPSLEVLDYKPLQWPGHGVGDHQPYQYLDREYMLKDEYDEILSDPTGFYFRKYLPRVAGALEGMADMPYLPGGHYFRLVAGLRAFNKPSVKQAFENLFKAAAEVEVMSGHNAAFGKSLTELGYPRDAGGISVSPLRHGCRLFPRRALNDDRPVPQQGQAPGAARQGAHLADQGDHRQRQGDGPSDCDDSDPLGAGCVHVGQAVQGVLLAALPADDDRHDRCRGHSHAALGGRLHQAARGHQGYSRRERPSTGSSAPIW